MQSNISHLKESERTFILGHLFMVHFEWPWSRSTDLDYPKLHVLPWGQFYEVFIMWWIRESHKSRQILKGVHVYIREADI